MSTAHLAMGPGGEFDLVRRMQALWGELAVGLGDDTAVLDIPSGEQVVTSTDVAVEGVHFRRDWLTMREIAARAVIAAVSDLAAAAAHPRGVLVGLTLPVPDVAPMASEEIDELALGIADAVRASGARIVGGDLTRGPVLSLAVTVLGSAARPLSRRGARPGDGVYVTGVLGGPALALAAWGRGERPGAWARARFAVPQARWREARWLQAAGAQAAIDLSDGLASELRHLAAASGVELRIDVARIPVGDGAPWEVGAASGEEYELLVTSPRPLDADAFARAFGVPLTRIGTVRAAEAPMVTALRDGERVDLPSGHDHFSP